MTGKEYASLSPEERKAYHAKEEADRLASPAHKAKIAMEQAYKNYSRLAEDHYKKYGKQMFSSIDMQLSQKKVDEAEKFYIQSFNTWQLIR